MIPRPFRRLLLSMVIFANAKAKRLAIRLTKWTGKSSEYIHPKHLLGETDEAYWYLAYLSSDAVLLDVGCGNGMHTLKAARRCARTVAVDANRESLGVGTRLSRALGVSSVSFLAGDVEVGLPLRRARFDIVLCLDLLEHVRKRDLVLAEIRRVLKPGGKLLLAVPNRATSWKRRLERAGLPSYSDPDHKIEYTLEELEQELDRNHFQVIRLLPTVYDTPLTGLMDLAGSISLTLYRKLIEVRRRLAQKYPGENAGFYAVCAVK